MYKLHTVCDYFVSATSTNQRGIEVLPKPVYNQIRYPLKLLQIIPLSLILSDSFQAMTSNENPFPSTILPKILAKSYSRWRKYIELKHNHISQETLYIEQSRGIALNGEIKYWFVYFMLVGGVV